MSGHPVATGSPGPPVPARHDTEPWRRCADRRSARGVLGVKGRRGSLQRRGVLADQPFKRAGAAAELLMQITSRDDRARRPRAGKHQAHHGLGRRALQQRGGQQASTAADDPAPEDARTGPDRAGDDCVLERQGRRDRDDQRQAAALPLDLLAVLPAASALGQVAAQVRPPQSPAVHRRELLADLRAVSLARGAAG